MKRLVIWSFSGPYFPTFGLNTDKENSEYGHFSRSAGQFASHMSNPVDSFVNLATGSSEIISGGQT